MDWNPTIEKLKPYIVKIETPDGSGTGFLCFYNDNKSWCGVATALHVVQHADEWRQPIKLLIISKGNFKTIFLKEGDRVIFSDINTDSAIIFFENPKDYKFPQETIPLRPTDKPLNIGFEIGWLGYPYIEPYNLCFFAGCVSARRERWKSYLIDGVSINGVSGGPVFYIDKETVEIIGIISAYAANRAAGEALPGLAIAQDVSHFHEVVQKIRSFDDALKKKQQMKAEEAKKQQEQSTTPK